MENVTEQTAVESPGEYSIPGLPLAVYREIAAHLRQVEGVEVSPIAQTSQEFDYNLSQIAGLQIQYGTEVEAIGHQRVEQILTYYRDRYGVGK